MWYYTVVRTPFKTTAFIATSLPEAITRVDELIARNQSLVEIRSDDADIHLCCEIGHKLESTSREEYEEKLFKIVTRGGWENAE